MSANIHPPMLTDVISNPAMHSMEEFWTKWGVTHADLNNVLNTWLVMIIFVVLALLIKNKLEMIPKGMQNFWEVVVSVLEDLVVETMGEKGRPYFPLIATLALFILAGNLIGIIPYFLSYTANLNTTLALALCAFFVTHYVGITKHGTHYIKHFLGPVPW
ncbi:MAG: FoF1 ATP synthase subunit a, partial [Desulfomonilaceae bacterium]|nr:FoF1 ATP synthase subunit a [Desulfomonilaceae bacterium]